MLNRQTANWITQKWDALTRRLRWMKYRFLGVRLLGDVHLRRISIPRNFHDIEIARGTTLDDGIVLIVSGEPHGRPKIRIGENGYLNRNTIIDASLEITIGAAAMIGPGCYITDHDHGMAAGSLVGAQPLAEAPVAIGRDAWLGAGVIVLKGVTIGDGAVVGAGSVVTRDIPPNSIAAGVPAKVLRERT